MDWIPIYAEARIAFPPDVMLRTEDDARGGWRITAYRTEFVPPLPEHLRGTVEPNATDVLYPAGEDDHLAYSRAEVWHLSFIVRDPHMAAEFAGRAARRWEHEARIRGA